MAAHGDYRTIDVDAPPARCFSLMTDYERIPREAEKQPAQASRA